MFKKTKKAVKKKIAVPKKKIVTPKVSIIEPAIVIKTEMTTVEITEIPVIKLPPVENFRCNICNATYKSNDERIIVDRDCIICGKYDCVMSEG